MEPNWEKGVVTGYSPRLSRFFISTKNNEVWCNEQQSSFDLKIGDCVEIVCRRNRIEDLRKCAPFIQFELDITKKSCLIICEIVDVKEAYHEESQKVVRYLQTNFLERVWDSSFHAYTAAYSDRELIGMKVKCVRVTNRESKRNYFWSVKNVKRFIKEMNEPASTIDSYDNHPSSDISPRKMMKGFVFRAGKEVNGTEKMFIWVPFRINDIFFPLSLRSERNSSHFVGRWLSFLVDEHVVLDRFSDIQLIDDHLPTRRRMGRYEIKVPCSFTPKTANADGHAKIVSKMCGTIVDDSGTLAKYNRLHSFDDSAWVINYMYDYYSNIRFVLSDLQDEWLYRDFFKQNDTIEHDNRRNQRRTDFENYSVASGSRSIVEPSMRNTDFRTNENLEYNSENYQQDGRNSSDPRRRETDRNQAKEGEKQNVSSLESKLKEYETLVDLFRKSLSNREVRDAVRRFDPEVADRIHDELFSL